MRATRFRVQNFRNIEDSGWVALERMTSFVGRNEAGKSSLLKALHKFNPAKPEPYDAQREFPRDRYTRDYLAGGANGGDWPVCSVEFEIPSEIQGKISRLLDPVQNLPVSVIATRYFGGTLSLSYRPHIKVNALTPDLVIDALRTFASAVRLSEAVSERQQQAADQELSSEIEPGKLSDWAMGWTETLAEVSDLRHERGAGLLQRLCGQVIDSRRPETERATNALLSAVEPSLRAASRGSPVERIDRLIERNLPVFIYFENYGVLDSAISLPQFLKARENDPFNPRVRTIDAMFKHVALDPTEIADLGEHHPAPISGQDDTSLDRSFAERAWPRKEERAIKLSAASLDISRAFSAWWSQRRHRIRYHADGDYFRVWVADNRLTDVEIELEQRSKGFQWFFSFYLVFLAESEAGHKSAILLLDEPGLHLHPTAQQELVAFLANLSKANQLVYTTHSPFLIDGKHLSRVRPIVEDGTGHSKVATESWPQDSEAAFPIRVAAAFAAVKEIFQDRLTVLVGDWSDFYYLHLLSGQCAATGRTALPEGVLVVPCGGWDGIGYRSLLCATQDHGALVLLDSEEVGRGEHDALYQGSRPGTGERIVLLDRAIGRAGSGAQFEDILGKELVVKSLEPVIGKSLPVPEVDTGVTSLVQRIQASAKRHDVRLPVDWRTSVAQRLSSSWAEQGFVLDDDTLDDAESLFSALIAASDCAYSHTGRVEDAIRKSAGGSHAKESVANGVPASVSVQSDTFNAGAEGIDDTNQEFTDEDRNVLEMIARMNDEATEEADAGSSAEEDPEERGVLERIAGRENQEAAEAEEESILEQVADRENEERGADRRLRQR